MIRKALFGILLIVGVSAQADVTRHPLPNNSTFPISMAVEVSSDTTLIYHSGQLPNVANPDADKLLIYTPTSDVQAQPSAHRRKRRP